MDIPQHVLDRLPQPRQQKGLRDQPSIYAEKKRARSISLTDTAMQKADDMRSMLTLSSRSEAIEIALRLCAVLPNDVLSQAIESAFE
jgi:hypothetical protein